jgi:hypothetical protein
MSLYHFDVFSRKRITVYKIGDQLFLILRDLIAELSITHVMFIIVPNL